MPDLLTDGRSPHEAANAQDTMGLRLWVAPHTHWDREWYLPFEQFRVQLATLIDDLLEALDDDPELAFSLDGQAVILEDYLELRPEQEGRLRRLMASGRIAVGPCYVLQDEFLVGQESLIRNLLMGRHVCLRHGTPPMGVAYAPDTFGHVAQLPQILRGFGIDSLLFWRGLGDEADRLGAIFQWDAPNGSHVLAVRLLEGYTNARALGRWTRRHGPVEDGASWPAAAALRVAELLDRWREPIRRAGLQDVLLANGGDHLPVQRDLPRMLAACRARFPAATFRICTFQGYARNLRFDTESLDTHSGELVGGKEACVVRGVNSTRIYLKQANEATERELFVAETLASLAWLRDRTSSSAPSPAAIGEAIRRYRYPLQELRLAWRELLRNQPHDSLPGCSIDEVHKDMEQRFRSASQIARQVRRDALAALAGPMGGMRPGEAHPGAWSLVNLLPWSRAGLVELELPIPLRSARRLLAETPEGPIPVQISGRHADRRALVALDVPAFGATQLRLRPATDRVGSRAWGANRHTITARQGFETSSRPITPGLACIPGARAVGSRAIENEYYRVEAETSGTLSIIDRRTGEVWSGAHRFEDVADRGDEYSFCPVDGDQPWDSRTLRARSRTVAGGPVVAELQISLPARLPRALARDRNARSPSTVACPIRTVVRLTAGIDRIEFRTSVANRARDHRLRVLFPAPASNRSVRVEGHFAVLDRQAEPVWNGLWREPPARTHHTLGMVAAGRLALFSRGLPEYEAVPDAKGGVELALTLLRCVGWLSRSDLATRPGAEDPEIPTPDAQCQGCHRFEYAVSLRGDDTEARLVRASQDYRVGLSPGPAGIALEGVLSVEGEGLAFSALKGAEDGQGLVLRLYNPGRMPAAAHLAGTSLAMRRCRLDETETESGPIEQVALRAGEIGTLRISPCPAQVRR